MSNVILGFWHNQEEKMGRTESLNIFFYFV
jgi:hypothetical protein